MVTVGDKIAWWSLDLMPKGQKNTGTPGGGSNPMLRTRKTSNTQQDPFKRRNRRSSECGVGESTIWKTKIYLRLKNISWNHFQNLLELCSRNIETYLIVENTETEIYSHFFDKNFVKMPALPKNLLNSWFDEIFFFLVIVNFSFCHTVLHIVEKWKIHCRSSFLTTIWKLRKYSLSLFWLKYFVKAFVCDKNY